MLLFNVSDLSLVIVIEVLNAFVQSSVVGRDLDLKIPVVRLQCFARFDQSFRFAYLIVNLFFHIGLVQDGPESVP